MMEKKLKKMQTGAVKRTKAEEQLQVYKYQAPVKDFEKYKATKIKVIQDITAHSHHDKHPMNIFFNQYNEFIKLVFKNGKTPNPAPIGNGQSQKINQTYTMGLARALGMNLRKDALSDANMKSRDHQMSLKEKLIFCLWKKLNEENRDVNPGI